ncbi:MAG: putative glucose-phosphate cytidylyltransferase [Bacteroidota bacterium]|jgi:glucose-1-phosphate cytidylyltransferase
MKVVLFAGGLGTRISEESHLRPKPMIEIGGKPILWHIMKMYAHHGFNEFIVCCGYKASIIKGYFANYFALNSDCTIDLSTNSVEVHTTHKENLKVTLIDTGVDTMTAGRLRQVLPYTNNETFMLTYGDGVCDVDLNALLDFHNAHGKICTMTTVQPTSRFGVVGMQDDGTVTSFEEKPADSGTWINGGFFVVNKDIAKYLHDDANDVMWERQPMYDLARDSQIVGYKHRGFWKCMDTMRDKEELEHMWLNNPAWKKW